MGRVLIRKGPADRVLPRSGRFWLHLGMPGSIRHHPLEGCRFIEEHFAHVSLVASNPRNLIVRRAYPKASRFGRSYRAAASRKKPSCAPPRLKASPSRLSHSVRLHAGTSGRGRNNGARGEAASFPGGSLHGAALPSTRNVRSGREEQGTVLTAQIHRSCRPRRYRSRPIVYWSAWYWLW